MGVVVDIRTKAARRRRRHWSGGDWMVAGACLAALAWSVWKIATAL